MRTGNGRRSARARAPRESVVELAAVVFFPEESLMKRVVYVMSAVTVLAVSALSAQMPQGQKVGLSTSLQRGYAGLKRNFQAAAEKMPEADYAFKPGSTPEARTFAQV